MITLKPKEYEIGYAKPPEQTRWKKGQSGNPKRIRKRRPKPVITMIEEFFAGEINVVDNGRPRRMTNFGAILVQLWNEATRAGNTRAMTVLLKYQKFAASRGGMPGIEVIQRRTEHLIPEDKDKND